MAIDAYGFTGTVNEAQWARLATMLGTDYSVEYESSQLVTAVASTRSISVAAGRSLGKGVVANVTAAVVKALPVPTAGQWFLIVMRRDWSSHACTVEVLPGVTTTTAVPEYFPSGSVAERESTPGVKDDQPLAWAWVNNLSTAVTVFDIRKRRLDDRTLTLAFSDLTDVPETFAPSAHSLASHTGSLPYDRLSGAPTSLPPGAHSLDSHTGLLAVAKGGTGASTAANARTALGAAPVSHDHITADVTHGGSNLQTIVNTLVAFEDSATTRGKALVAASSLAVAREQVGIRVTNTKMVAGTPDGTLRAW